MIEQFLTTEQVANILQVHPFTILKFLKHGKLKGIKLGRVYRIKESDVHEFLENRSTGKRNSSTAHQQNAIVQDNHPISSYNHSEVNDKEISSEIKIQEHYRLQKEPKESGEKASSEGKEQHFYII